MNADERDYAEEAANAAVMREDQDVDLDAIRARADARYAPDIFAAPGDVDALLDEVDDLRGANAYLTIRNEEVTEDLHNEWDFTAKVRAEVAALTADRDALTAEVEQLREHSTTLNTIAWKIATALGDVPNGAERIEGNPAEQADRLIAEVERLRAELAEAQTTIRALVGASS